MNTKAVALVVLALVGGGAHAQTACPYGAAQGSAMCLPDAPAASVPTAPLPPRWKLTWGAIAFDVTTGATGYAVGEPSRRRASRQAVSQCAGKGGRDCKVALAHHNQCAVIADPVRDGRFVAGQSIYQGGPTVEDASRIALSACSRENNGGQCEVVYSACSGPVLVG